MTQTQDINNLPEEDPEAKCPSSPKGINAAKVQGAVRPRRVGGVTTYQCKKKYPYAVGGQSKITCQEDGTYDGEPLECSGLFVGERDGQPLECSGLFVGVRDVCSGLLVGERDGEPLVCSGLFVGERDGEPLVCSGLLVGKRGWVWGVWAGGP